MLVIGGRDLDAGAVSVRLHGKGPQGTKPKARRTFWRPSNQFELFLPFVSALPSRCAAGHLGDESRGFRSLETDDRFQTVKAHIKALLIAGLLLADAPLHLHAQVVADGQTNTLDNVTNTLVGNVVVGTNGSFTLLNIINGALLTNSGNGYIGSNVTANANTVRVTVPNSRWNMGADLNGPQLRPR